MDKFQCADEVIADIKALTGKDYSAVRDQIADLFWNDLWNGHWDSSTDFENPAFPDIRFIQEDEYDQHMDTTNMPEPLTYSAGHYIFIV